MNRNRFKVGAISALIVLASSLLVGLTTAPPASAATYECSRARTMSQPNTPAGRYVYMPYYPTAGGGYLYDCWMAKGSRSVGVQALQQAINLCYNAVPNLATDGIYGEATKAAVEVVQATHRIKADGEYGPNTRDAMIFPEYRTVDNGFSGTCR
ncbi:peptidoglycan-binding protein [Nocardioides sp. NPDC059952]|uniref:peptidoglycan-binding domain-containing protein n=1 Tax=Nocardioides sp. NPDC059952 TaxID=3347014 RepID=UPI003665788F